MRARFVLSEMAIGLRRNLTMTIAVVITVAISLALLGVGLMLRSQVGKMKGFWYDKVEVSVFLCNDGDQAPPCNGKGVTEPQKQQILGELQALPDVKNVFYESQAEAYQRFKEQFKDSPDLVRNVTQDQLPQSYRVKLNDPTKFAVVKSRFEGEPGVNSVVDQRQLLEKFFNVLDGLRNFGLLFALFAIVAAVILVSNTVRLAAYSRRREISIMRLVGASNFYIQLPFLLEGAIAGLIGSLVSAAGLVLFQRTVINGLFRPKFTFTPFIGWDTVWRVDLLLVLTGVVLASAVAFLTMSMSRAARV